MEISIGIFVIILEFLFWRAHSQADKLIRQDRKHQEVTHKQAVY